MKTLIKTTLVIFMGIPMLGIAQSAQNASFVLNGKVSDTQKMVGNMIYLKYAQNGKAIIDSSKVVNNTYHFKGAIAYPVKATLQLKVADSVEKYYKATRLLKPYAHEFYLDGGKLDANSTAVLYDTKVKGSAADSDRQLLKSELEGYYKRSSELYTNEGSPAYKNKDSVAIARFTKKSYAIEHQVDSVKKSFMLGHPKSGIILDILQEHSFNKLESSEIEPIFKGMQKELKSSPEGKAYAAKIEKAKETAYGVQAPDIVLKNREGKDVSLSSLKGKLVLLDFWGSWCFPCRQTHPHLRKLYSEYQAKGFEIYGVANERGNPDENYKKWTAALDEDRMGWINVLNDKTKDAARIYNVSAFPTKVLIDKNGKIIKRLIGNTPENEEILNTLIKKNL